jgi:hypothetical protein
MALDSAAIATGIAAMTVAGITIRDVTAIPEQVQARDCPILFPDASKFVVGGNGEPANGPATFGVPGDRLWQFNRTFSWLYLHSAVGSKRGILDHYSGMCTNCDAILTAIAELDLYSSDNSEIDVMSIQVGQFGTVQDPAGAMFFGFSLSVQFREKIHP